VVVVALAQAAVELDGAGAEGDEGVVEEFEH
jgi:hypothetical protein